MNTPPRDTKPGSRTLLAAGILAAAAGLMLLAANAHMEQACAQHDTPYLALCEPEQEESTATLYQHVARNPGDASAWTRLVSLEEGRSAGAVLDAAAVVAPNHGTVLRQRAQRALDEGRMEEAVALLVQLQRYRKASHPSKALARIMASDDGLRLLRPHLPDARYWLPGTLTAITTLKLPLSTALPLIAEAEAGKLVPPELVAGYMRSLKQQGYWADAYALWLARHGEPVPLLYNGSFDQPLRTDGFDWEVEQAARTRAGTFAFQPLLAGRGRVLDIEFTGRPFKAPVVRQRLFVFALSGNYELRGQYTAARLNTTEGLVWRLRCSSGQLVAESPPLLETGGMWKTFEIDIALPPDCGETASLQLETIAAYDTAAGFKGRISFDAMHLGKAGDTP